MSKALIMSVIAGTYKIKDLDNKNIFVSKPRGVLKIKGMTPKVGDIVDYTITSDSLATLDNINPRHNDLIRPFISNVDQVLLVFSVKEPALNLNLLDKFLVSLEFNNLTPIIIFSKWDLLEEKELDEVEKIKTYYENIGYKIITTSINNPITDELKEIIKGKISVVTGQSGVGKSSLLNQLDANINLKTNEISQALNRGKHTTRHVELFEIFDGLIADTPGFGDLDFFDMSTTDLAQNFIEFFKASRSCKYPGCLHLNEPSCMVKQLLSEGKILNSRYDNYKLFNCEIEKKKKY